MNSNQIANISRSDTSVLNQIFSPILPSVNLDDFDSRLQNECVPDDTNVEDAKALEVEGVHAAEQGDIDRAVGCFTQAIRLAPHWPSSYNNRAQALRLIGDIAGSVEDLNMALVLCEGHGKAACQAYTQRALVKRLQGDETGALEDFRAAAGLGSKFAKQMVVAMNPYAALCNQMLGEVMSKLHTGQGMG